MVLGLLASNGPRHGHQIRRDAERMNVGNWGGVSVGALYREIRQMENENLIEPLRTEQVGRRPARTVYQITEAGSRELHVLRGEAIRALHFGPDAFGVALLFGWTWGRSELRALLQERRNTLAAAMSGLQAECARLQAQGEIGTLDVLMFRRRGMQLEAELRWHEEFETVLSELPEAKPTADAAVSGSEEPSPVVEESSLRKPKGPKKRREP